MFTSPAKSPSVIQPYNTFTLIFKKLEITKIQTEHWNKANSTLSPTNLPINCRVLHPAPGVWPLNAWTSLSTKVTTKMHTMFFLHSLKEMWHPNILTWNLLDSLNAKNKVGAPFGAYRRLLRDSFERIRRKHWGRIYGGTSTNARVLTRGFLSWQLRWANKLSKRKPRRMSNCLTSGLNFFIANFLY